VAAALTLLFDAIKGAASVLIVRHYFGADAALFAGLGAVARASLPDLAEVQGGKGVAVALGILLTLYWPAALCAAGDVAGDAGAVPDFVAVGPGHGGGGAGLPVPVRADPCGDAELCDGGCWLGATSIESELSAAC